MQKVSILIVGILILTGCGTIQKRCEGGLAKHSYNGDVESCVVDQKEQRDRAIAQQLSQTSDEISAPREYVKPVCYQKCLARDFGPTFCKQQCK